MIGLLGKRAPASQHPQVLQQDFEAQKDKDDAPSSSALDWNQVPQRLPTFTPMQESRKVVAAMKHTA